MLKTWPEYFQAIVRGEKTFEVRKDDRGFAVGDTLVLQEYDPDKKEYTGEKTSVRVTYKMDGGNFGVADGYCVLGIKTAYERP